MPKEMSRQPGFSGTSEIPKKICDWGSGGRETWLKATVPYRPLVSATPLPLKLLSVLFGHTMAGHRDLLG